MMTIPFAKLRQKWMKDPKFRAEYERIGPGMDLAMTLSEARRKAGLTQVELAARMKTSQASVARIESGHGAPKWETIERYARALGATPVVRLVDAAGRALNTDVEYRAAAAEVRSVAVKASRPRPSRRAARPVKGKRT
jgi:transcriptional regulator with XRE-family HTH domain